MVMKDSLLSIRAKCAKGKGANNFAFVEKDKITYNINVPCLAAVPRWTGRLEYFVDYPLSRVKRKPNTTAFRSTDKKYCLS